MAKKMMLIFKIIVFSLFFVFFVSYSVKAESSTGVITGKVGEIVEVEDDFDPPFLKGPLIDDDSTSYEIEYHQGVRVYVDLDEYDDFIQAKCVFTDENGEYSISLPAGSYSIITEKNGFESTVLDEVDVGSEGSTQVDIAITKGQDDDSRYFPLSIDKYRDIVESATKNNSVGCDFTIQNVTDIEGYKKIIVLYENLLVNPLNISNGNISFTVDGEDIVGGRTIVLHVEEDLFDLGENMSFTYDNLSIRLAGGIEDVLNPDDDGIYPEYFLVNASKGIQIFVSIPHFSKHKISIFNVFEEQTFDEIPAEIVNEAVKKVGEYKEVAVLLAFIVIVVSAVFMFRKDRED